VLREERKWNPMRYTIKTTEGKKKKSGEDLKKKQETRDNE